MIYEYAIDPQLILNWAQSTRDYREFIHAFGIGQPRVLGGFPKFKNWKRLVLRSIPSTFSETASSRAIELVSAIGDSMVQRNMNEYDGTKDWDNNIKAETSKAAFDRIFVLSKSNSSIESAFEQKDIYNNPGQHWEFPLQVLVNRTADDMANAVANMLRLANHIIFIDPHIKISPDKLRPITAYIEKSLKDRVSNNKPLVEIMCDINSNRSPTANALFRGISDYIGENIDKIELSIKQLEELPSGEKLHNRYILTDIGGVSFGVGLDEQDEAHTDEVTLLSKEAYMLRWGQYVEGNGFSLVDSYP